MPPQPPSGREWQHEIKFYGFRVIARKEGKRVRLYSRPGNDLTYRFPLIVEALARLRSRSARVDEVLQRSRIEQSAGERVGLQRLLPGACRNRNQLANLLTTIDIKRHFPWT
jgi:hypothetical protein